MYLPSALDFLQSSNTVQDQTHKSAFLYKESNNDNNNKKLCEIVDLYLICNWIGFIKKSYMHVHIHIESFTLFSYSVFIALEGNGNE